MKNQIWGVRSINESSDELLSFLSKKELYLPFIENIASENRKREWLAVRVLLKILLNEEKEIRYTDSGRPYLADRSYHISISHTKGYVAVVLCKDKPVGIDIEYISSRVQKIQNRFLNEREKSNISLQNECIHILLHWSAKESLFKVLGEQDIDFKSCLHIDRFEPQFNEVFSFSAKETKTDYKHNFKVNYLVDTNYVLTFTDIPSSK